MSMSRQQRRELERKQRKAERRETKGQSVTAPITPTRTGPTGPRTEQGKAISAGNSLRHGLTAARMVLPWESQADYDNLLAKLTVEHDPQTAIETIYVNEMAENWWRLQRARDKEYDSLIQGDELLHLGGPESDILAWEKAHARIIRYATGFERGFHRAHRMLRALQKERNAKQSEKPVTQPAQFSSKAEFVSKTEFVSKKLTPKHLNHLKPFDPFTTSLDMTEEEIMAILEAECDRELSQAA